MKSVSADSSDIVIWTKAGIDGTDTAIAAK